MGRVGDATGEQRTVGLQLREIDPGANRFPGLFGDLELNGSLGFLLHDDRPTRNPRAMRDVARLQLYEVTRSELRIDGKIEQGEVSRLMSKLEPHANSPDVA